MAMKHVTALGKPFDMDALRAKNEKVRAVGNMNVNARGDIIDSNNNVINDSATRVNTMYNRTNQSIKTPKKAEAKVEIPTSELSDKELKDLDDDLPNPKK